MGSRTYTRAPRLNLPTGPNVVEEQAQVAEQLRQEMKRLPDPAEPDREDSFFASLFDDPEAPEA